MKISQGIVCGFEPAIKEPILSRHSRNFYSGGVAFFATGIFYAIGFAQTRTLRIVSYNVIRRPKQRQQHHRFSAQPADSRSIAIGLHHIGH